MELEKMIDLIIEAEGGYVNDPNDRGGATKYGITQATLNMVTDSAGGKRMKVRDLSLAMARSIYRDRYIAPCVTWNDAVTLLIFDWGVNSGIATSIKGLQRILGVSEDGIIGSITNKAIRKYASIDMLVARIVDARHCFYGGIVSRNASQARFILGWARRVSKLLHVIEDERLTSVWRVAQ